MCEDLVSVCWTNVKKGVYGNIVLFVMKTGYEDVFR